MPEPSGAPAAARVDVGAAVAHDAPKNRLDLTSRSLYPAGVPRPTAAPEVAPRPVRHDDTAPAPTIAATPRAHRFLQVHRSYLVVETDDGVRIVDQHALHERKLYDELLARFRATDAEDQLLLVPEPFDPGPADRARLMAFAEDLARLGLRIEHFGPSALCLRSLPAALRRADPADLIAAALDRKSVV